MYDFDSILKCTSPHPPNFKRLVKVEVVNRVTDYITLIFDHILFVLNIYPNFDIIIRIGKSLIFSAPKKFAKRMFICQISYKTRPIFDPFFISCNNLTKTP